MKYKKGDKVKIKSLDWYKKNKDEGGSIWCALYSFTSEKAKLCDSVRTIKCVSDNGYYVDEDFFIWKDEMIEGLAEEKGVSITETPTPTPTPKLKPTRTPIDAIIYESCVAFCKHCGCGIPRDTCISLGTCKEHDEYRVAVRELLEGIFNGKIYHRD